MKALILLLKTLFWLWIFFVPTSVMSFIAFLLMHSVDHFSIPFILIPTGMVVGVTAAEHIRRKYGLDYLFGGLLSTPELRNESEDGSDQ
jgi:hypothetical protein